MEMSERSEMIAKKVELAASRASSPEDLDIVMITGEATVRGLGRSSVVVEQRHQRRLKTLRELLDLRLQLEGSTPLPPEEESSWYEHLVGSLTRIVEIQAARVLAELEEDAKRFGTSPLSGPARSHAVGELDALRSQYLDEADILRRSRALEARMPKPSPPVTLNINQSTVANLNLGTQVGHIQNAVGGLQEKGLTAIADAIKQLAEGVVNEPALSQDAKREAIEMVSSMSEEIAKPDAERRGSVLRMAGTALWAIIRNLDKFRVPYEIVRGGARSQGIELPPWPGA